MISLDYLKLSKKEERMNHCVCNTFDLSAFILYLFINPRKAQEIISFIGIFMTLCLFVGN